MAETQPVPSEYYKAMFEYIRFLVTLSSGSILLIATFMENLFQNPSWKIAVVIALAAFMISIVSSIAAYTIGLLFVFPEKKPETEKWALDIGKIGFLLTWIGFLVGMHSLTTFAIRNLLN